MTKFESLKKLCATDDLKGLAMFFIETFNRDVYNILNEDAKKRMIEDYKTWLNSEEEQ